MYFNPPKKIKPYISALANTKSYIGQMRVSLIKKNTTDKTYISGQTWLHGVVEKVIN